MHNKHRYKDLDLLLSRASRTNRWQNIHNANDSQHINVLFTSQHKFEVEQYFVTHTLYFVILVLEFALQWWADIPSSVNYFRMSENDEKIPLISTEDNINTEEIVVSPHVSLHCNSHGSSR